MRNTLLIARRELATYLRTPTGWLIAACALLIDGFLYNAYALGSVPKLSSEVLQGFFYFSSGTTIGAAILLSMRLIAEERQMGTLVLLFTSPVREGEIVLGKFLAALVFLSGTTLLSIYMPALIFVNGKVSIGHILAGYAGLLMLGAATLAVGMLCSAIARTQLVAGVLSTFFVLLLCFNYKLAQIADEPLNGVVAYLGLYSPHFIPFQHGIFALSGVVFYASVTYFALLAATRVLHGQRWQ